MTPQAVDITKSEQRIIDVAYELGYKDFTKGTRKGLITGVEELRFPDTDGRVFAVEAGKYDYKVCGKYPIFPFPGPRPELSMRVDLVSNTLKKRLAKFIEEFKVADASAVEELKRKEQAEKIAETVTDEIRKALHIPESQYKDFKIEARPAIERSMHKYDFLISLNGSWTPNELVTIGKICELNF